MEMKNVIVAQSGGPTSAINASLSGVLKAVLDSPNYDICYGAVNGILGVLSENYLNITQKAQNDNDFIDLLTHTPAMYLGSCRYKLPDYRDDDSSYSFIFSQFRKLNIGAFFYIGGNDSMDTVLKLSDYARVIGSDIKIIGVPKTIDNDLCNTDHTPGFGSAAKYIASSMLEIAHDTFIYAVKSVTIVEIMGRDAGWLTAAASLARNGYSSAPHLIYLPEVPFDKVKFLADVRGQLNKRNNVIIAVSEGIRDKDGNYITSSKAMADTFGHQQLSGAGKALEFLVKENIDVKVRSVEINVLQRCAAVFSGSLMYGAIKLFSLCLIGRQKLIGFNAQLNGYRMLASILKLYQSFYHHISVQMVNLSDPSVKAGNPDLPLLLFCLQLLKKNVEVPPHQRNNIFV